MIHDFKNSLQNGKKGEDAFHAANPHLTRLDGFKSDFIDEATGKTYELKTDFYDATKTENFFIEVLSNADKGTLGGPCQSALNGTTYYVYYFIKNNLTYTFEVEKLVLWLKDYILNERPPIIEIYNTRHVTTGHIIKRELLKDLYTIGAINVKTT